MAWARQDQRLDRLAGKANQLLAKFGVPEVQVAAWGTGVTAGFMRGVWTMSIGDGLLEAKEADVEAFARLAGSIYHEARHAEQTFRVARKLAAEGESIDDIARKLGIRETGLLRP